MTSQIQGSAGAIVLTQISVLVLAGGLVLPAGPPSGVMGEPCVPDKPPALTGSPPRDATWLPGLKGTGSVVSQTYVRAVQGGRAIHFYL